MKQNYLIHLGSCLLAGAGLMLGSGAALAENGYIMKCTGGGTMQAVTTWQVNGAGDKTTTEVFFTPATTGFRTRLPAAGSCAWETRAIRADEPHKLTVSFRTPLEVRCARRQCDVMSGNSDMLELQAYVQAGAPFKLLVRNNNAGGFKVIQVLD